MITTIYRVGITIPDDVADDITHYGLETAFDSMYLKATEGANHAETCSYSDVMISAEFFKEKYALACEAKLCQMVQELRALIARKAAEREEENGH